MKYHARCAERKFQQGTVAVEAAVCIAFILVPMIAFLFAFGRFFWCYTAIQKSMHDAAIYMANAPSFEVKSSASLNLAKDIFIKEISDIAPDVTIYPALNCGYKLSPNFPDLVFRDCIESTLPDAVQASAIITVPLQFGFYETSIETRPIVVMPYVGK